MVSNNSNKPKPLCVAGIQLVSGADLDTNLRTAERWILEAVGQGASLVVLPENFALMGAVNSTAELARQEYQTAFLQTQLSQWAAMYKVCLVAGTLPLIDPEHSLTKPLATTLVFDDEGSQIARYQKMHLFDVDVNDAHGRYRESDDFIPGNQPVVFQWHGWTIGLSICYDVRFPEYYRLLAEQGAEVMLVPAAFTYTTGKAHWDVLLRARAIENQCFLVAPNQGGHHGRHRRTWGHSSIISPWGEVMASLKEGEAVVMAWLDYDELVELRQKMPVLSHRRIATVL